MIRVPFGPGAARAARSRPTALALSFTLALALVLPRLAAAPTAAAETNDRFRDAAPLLVPGVVRGTTSAATAEIAEPAPSCLPPGYAGLGKTLWYRLGGATSGTISALVAETGGFLPILVLYQGSSLGTLQELACGAELQLTATLQGGPYYLQIGGPSGMTAASGGADRFATGGSFRLMLSPENAVTGAPLPQPPTSTPTPISEATATETATPTTSPATATSTPTAAPTFTATGTSTALPSATPTPGNVPPLNDDYAAALAVTVTAGSATGPITGTTRFATLESGEPVHAGNWSCYIIWGHQYYSTVWFTFTPAVSGTLTASTANTGTNFDTALALYEKAPSVDALGAPVTCDNNGDGENPPGSSPQWSSILRGPVEAGRTYYLQLGGIGGATAGEYALTLALAAASTPTATPTPRVTPTAGALRDRAYVANSNGDSVSIVDTASNTTLATVPVGDNPYGIAVSPDGSRAYATNYLGGSVSVLDAAGRSVLATIPVGPNPHGLAVSPSGARVYVAVNGAARLTALDASSNAVVQTIALPSPDGSASQPVGVAVSPNGSRVYVTNYRAGSGRHLWAVDPSDGAVAGNVEVGTGPFAAAVSPDGSRVYVANAFSNSISVVSAASLSVTATIGTDIGPVALAFSPDGSRLYAALREGSSGLLAEIDTATNRVAALIQLPGAARGVAVSQDGNRAYVAIYRDGTGSSVAVVDLAAHSVTGSVSVGAGPFGIALAGAGGIETRSLPTTPTPTHTAVPTATSTATATATATAVPSPTATASSTPTSVPATNTATSTPTATATATTTAPVVAERPSAPQNLRVAESACSPASGTASVSLRWDAPASGAVATYRVYRSTGTVFALAGTTDAAALAFTDPAGSSASPQCGRAYSYIVRAADAQGRESPNSNEVSVTP